MAYKSPLVFTSLDLFNRVDTQTITHDYRNRQAIFAQGDKADAMFYVRKGTVKLTVVSKSGKKAVIAILRHGDFFGEVVWPDSRCGRLLQRRFKPPPLPG